MPFANRSRSSDGTRNTRVSDKRTNRKHLNRGTRDRLRTRIGGYEEMPLIPGSERERVAITPDLQIILVRLCRAGAATVKRRHECSRIRPRIHEIARARPKRAIRARQPDLESSFVGDGSQKIAKSLYRGKRRSLSEASSFVSFARN